MDTLHSILFYALAAVAVGGALFSALGPSRLRRVGMLALAAGLAGLYADLSAAFAGVVALVTYGAIAALGHTYRRLEVPALARPPRTLAENLAGPLSAVAFVVLAYLAWRTAFHTGYKPDGEVNATALGRLLVNRDALALEAVAAALLLAAGGTRFGIRPRRP